MGDLISVIVPIYNIENYIDRCVISIINSTYFNIEIILVDDGSQDKGGVICDEWAQRDKRIKVIHKTNGGLSSARNVGLAAAEGKYVSFIDGDDEISPVMLERLHDKILQRSSDISMCRMEKIETQKRYITRAFPREAEEIELTSKEAIQLLLKDQIDCSACLKLYKKSLFDDIIFPVGLTNEDFAIMYRIFAKATQITYIQDVLYYYYYRENSITTTKFNERQFDKFDNALCMFEYIKEHFPDLKAEAYFYLYKQTMYLLKKLCCSNLKNIYREKYLQLKKRLRKGTGYFICSKNYSIKERGMYLCLAWFPALYKKINKTK